MSNPFEDLRQAVVVRPMNSPGPQGAAAPHMKIKYSADGVTWHNTPVETDKYLSFSTDNGITWSDAIYFNNLSETLEWVEKARQWAENPEGVEVEPGQYSALHHKEKALDAQIAAEISEANALVSATNAAASAENALTSAENAATSEANAKTSEINAATSEANALESASNAYTSEMNAAASEDKAAKWAQEDEDVVVEDGKYSAYHWAQKAGQIATSPPHGDEAHTEDYIKEGDPRLLNKLSIISVKESGAWGDGAYGDGIHDDTQAIINIINYAAGLGEMKTIYFPTGTYLVSAPIYIPSNLTLIGDGINNSVIKAKTGWVGSAYGILKINGVNEMSIVSNVKISRLSIDGNNVTNDCAGIQIYYAQDITISEILVKSTVSENISIQYGAQRVLVENSIFSIDNIEGSFCIQVYGADFYQDIPRISPNYPRDIAIINNRLSNANWGSIFVNSAQRVVIRGNHMSGGIRGVGAGIAYKLIDGTIDTLVAADKWSTKDIVIEGNIIENTTDFGIQTFYGLNYSICRNIVRNVLGTGGDRTCVTIDRSKDSIVSDNILIGSDNTGSVCFVTGAENVVVSGNKIQKGEYGIQISGNWEAKEESAIKESISIIVSNNNISDIQLVGIIINGGISVSVVGNIVRNSDKGIVTMGSVRPLDNYTMIADKIELIGNILVDGITSNSIEYGANTTSQFSAIGNSVKNIAGLPVVTPPNMVIWGNSFNGTQNDNRIGGITTVSGSLSRPVGDGNVANAWIIDMPSTDNNFHKGAVFKYSYGQLIMESIDGTLIWKGDVREGRLWPGLFVVPTKTSTTNIQTGDMYFDTTTNTLKIRKADGTFCTFTPSS